MKLRLLAVGIGCGMLLGAAAADRVEGRSRENNDMRRAIAWERYKDVAAARQAAKERRHPSVSYQSTEANRADEHTQPRGQQVTDPGPRDYRNGKVKK